MIINNNPKIRKLMELKTSAASALQKISSFTKSGINP